MNEHYIVTIDRGHLRIYSEAKSAGHRLEVVEALDLPAQRNVVELKSPEGLSVPFATPRLPNKSRDDRRNHEVLAAELDAFLQNRPTASWDLAAAPSLYNLIIELLSPSTRRRLKRALSKALVNLRTDEVRAHFASAVDSVLRRTPT